MTWLDRMEKHFGWLAFPGLLKGYAFLHVVVFILQLVNEEIGALLEFDREKILSGEVWRAFTFLFASSGAGIPNLFSVLFFIFMVMIALMMSDALEETWGVFRTSMFCYAGILCLSSANFLFGPLIPGSGNLFYGSVFFAFATVRPRTEFWILAFLPVQVRWLALVQAVFMLITAILTPVLFPYFLLANLHYLLWAGIPAMRNRLPRAAVVPVSKSPSEYAFHRCTICGKTDVSDPVLAFRVGEDGEEYCEEHQPGN